MPASIDHILKLIKEHPVLYHPNFKVSKKEADPIWNEVAAKVNMTGDELKKKWRNLRDSYAKYLKSPYSQNPLIKNYRNWHHADAMEYFRPYLPITKKIESQQIRQNFDEIQINELQDEVIPIIKIDISDTEFIDDNTYEYDNPLTINDNNSEYSPKNEESSFKNQPEEIFVENDYPPTKKQRVDENESVKSSQESQKDVSVALENVLNRTSNLELDSMELLFLGYAKLVSTFSLKRQAITKMKLAQLIMEQELEHYEEIKQKSK